MAGYEKTAGFWLQEPGPVTVTGVTLVSSKFLLRKHSTDLMIIILLYGTSGLSNLIVSKGRIIFQTVSVCRSVVFYITISREIIGNAVSKHVNVSILPSIS